MCLDSQQREIRCTVAINTFRGNKKPSEVKQEICDSLLVQNELTQKQQKKVLKIKVTNSNSFCNNILKYKC